VHRIGNVNQNLLVQAGEGASFWSQTDVPSLASRLLQRSIYCHLAPVVLLIGTEGLDQRQVEHQKIDFGALTGVPSRRSEGVVDMSVNRDMGQVLLTVLARSRSGQTQRPSFVKSSPRMSRSVTTACSVAYDTRGLSMCEEAFEEKLKSERSGAASESALSDLAHGVEVKPDQTPEANAGKDRRLPCLLSRLLFARPFDVSSSTLLRRTQYSDFDLPAYRSPSRLVSTSFTWTFDRDAYEWYWLIHRAIYPLVRH
jgi:hypothetical protein